MTRKIIISLVSICSLFIYNNSAKADTESWNWVELREPIIKDSKNLPNIKLRVFSDARLNTRSKGLGDLFLRVGPLVDVTPWLFIGLHGTLQANKTDTTFIQETRMEIEPNFYGRIGDFTFNDRNRLEYRMRETGNKFRYRNQLRFNYEPENIDMKNLVPYIWDEVLIDLAGEGFNQNRASIGIGYKFGKSNKIDLGYMLRSRFQSSVWIQDHILLISLTADHSKD